MFQLYIHTNNSNVDRFADKLVEHVLGNSSSREEYILDTGVDPASLPSLPDFTFPFYRTCNNPFLFEVHVEGIWKSFLLKRQPIEAVVAELKKRFELHAMSSIDKVVNYWTTVANNLTEEKIIILDSYSTIRLDFNGTFSFEQIKAIKIRCNNFKLRMLGVDSQIPANLEIINVTFQDNDLGVWEWFAAWEKRAKIVMNENQSL